ncbi:MAG: response regulator [Kordiimonadales bacterium]|nr:MAG: response regulator [Kordiimonadales bacterium]
MAKILVVDDEENSRLSMRMVLKAQGHDITEASNGREAEEILETAEFDLVITDIIMPEKEGIEFIGDISQQFPGLRVIAITGGGPPREGANRKAAGTRILLSTASLLGADAVLDKPFDPVALLDAVTRVLACKKRGMQIRRFLNAPDRL